MITKKIFFIAWIIGLMSGFAIMISGNTLNFWLAKEGINIKTIGMFALISLPYAINFIWAPLFDIKKIPVLHALFGQRLSWVLFTQVLLSIAVYLMSRLSPLEDIESIAVCGLLIAFLSSAQDTVLGALRTELVDKKQQGEISGMYVFGYRIGMLVASSGAIYLSQTISWNLIYELFSVVIITFPIVLIVLSKDFDFERSKFDNIPDLNTIREDSLFNRSRKFLLDLISPVGHYKYIIFVLIFLILYRLPDNFISMMINPFLLHIGYNEFEISTVGKLLGVTSAMAGGLIASHIMKKKDIYDSLLMFGAMHAAAHVLFIVQEIYGHNIYLLVVVTGFESISGGMAMAAYIAFIASLCQGKFRATQYSFFSSMMGLSRSIFPALSGYMVASFGWTVFYLFTTIATVPSLIMILYLEKTRKREGE